MMAFEISVNGRHVATIGVGELGVISTCVAWVAKRDLTVFHLHAGVMEHSTNDHLTWPMPAISQGDEVTIRVVESDTLTPGCNRTPQSKPIPPKKKPKWKRPRR